MIPIINEIGINLACFGNHEFDYGVDHLVNLLDKIDPKFFWLLSNLKMHDPLLANQTYIKEYHIQDINGLKIGFIGLMEKEWLTSCPMFFNLPVDYEDYVECSIRLVQILKQEKCDLIIAITHMRDHNNV